MSQSFRIAKEFGAVKVDSITDGDLTVSGTLSAMSTLKKITTATASTLALTATDSGKVIILDKAGIAISLPKVATAGCSFKFIVKTPPTSSSHVISKASTDSACIFFNTTSPCINATALPSSVTACSSISFVANKSLRGDMMEVICDGVSWYCNIVCNAIDAITSA